MAHVKTVGILQVGFSSSVDQGKFKPCNKKYFKDCLPHLSHGFRNGHFNKISLDNMFYFHN